MKKHKHHIIPRHMGGSDNTDNLVELTIDEHAQAHRELYEQYGHVQDKIAWMGLAKLAPHAELMYELNSERMKGSQNPMFGKPAPNRGIKRPGVGGRKKGTGWSAEERISATARRSTPEYKEKMAKVYADSERNNKISQKTKGRTGSATGKTWYNNGTVETYSAVPLEGWTKGRLPGRNTGRLGLRWYSNGTITKQFRLGEQPVGFVPGRLTKLTK